MPQPDGPISAVIAFRWMSSDDVLTARRLAVGDRQVVDVEDDLAAVGAEGGVATLERRDGRLGVLGGLDDVHPASLSDAPARWVAQDVNVV